MKPLEDLGWGYTLADIDSLAKGAARTVLVGGIPWHERYDIAWSAIAEHLYAASDPPPRRDLVQAGCAEIYATMTDNRRHHGGPRNGGEWGSSPAFARFWREGSDRFEDRLLDRIALGQVMAALPCHHRDALSARAAMQTADMAKALGISAKLATKWVRNARAASLTLWYDGETPPARSGRHSMRRQRSATVEPAQCGTNAAYARHRYKREQPCNDCREARRLYAAEHRARGCRVEDAS